MFWFIDVTLTVHYLCISDGSYVPAFEGNEYNHHWFQIFSIIHAMLKLMFCMRFDPRFDPCTSIMRVRNLRRYKHPQRRRWIRRTSCFLTERTAPATFVRDSMIALR